MSETNTAQSANTNDLVTAYAALVDEAFAADSKRSLITNQDYSWQGAHSVRVYTVTTSEMNDYDRNGTSGNPSRYGEVKPLSATTNEYTLSKDRSFTFVTDLLDVDETARVEEASAALARQVRQVVIPEIDSYTYNVMATKAGTKPAAVALTTENIYEKILDAGEALDNAEVPEVGRVLIVTPRVYATMKLSKDIAMDSDFGADLRQKGVVSQLDGALVVKVPANRLPENFGFMLAHPCACVNPVKLEQYQIHDNPPGISGSLIEGRVCYDAFVLSNKTKGIYYQALA